MGATAALVFCTIGSAYGTAKSGVGIAAMGVMKPHMVMKSILPGENNFRFFLWPFAGDCSNLTAAVIMSGVIAIYGLVLAILLTTKPIQDQLLIVKVWKICFNLKV